MNRKSKGGVTMDAFFNQYGGFILLGIGTVGTIFGLILTILERRLLVTRKPVAGTDGFAVTMYGCVAAALSIWVMTENLLYSGLAIAVGVVLYVIICFAVHKKEYPSSERFKKE